MTKSIWFIDINIGGLFSSFIPPSSTMISRKMCFCHFCASVKTFCIIPDSKNDFVSMESVPNSTKNISKNDTFFHVFVEFFFLRCNFFQLILAVCLQDQTKAHNFWTLPYIELQLFIPQVLIKVVHFY